MRSRWPRQLWLPTIVLLGAALRLFPVWFGLPYTRARPDEETALGQSLTMLSGDLNPGFFHWPSLTFYVFASLFKVATWIRQMTSPESSIPYPGYLVLARAFVALCGTLTSSATCRCYLCEGSRRNCCRIDKRHVEERGHVAAVARWPGSRPSPG